MDKILTLSLSSIGAVVVLSALYTVVGFVRLHFLVPSQPLRVYKRDDAGLTWALITGASAGIGLGTAQELVEHGFGVVILGHLADELSRAKRYLEQRTPGAAVHTVTMNAITATPEEMERMVQSLSNLHVTILVNNVGGVPIVAPPLRPTATHRIADVDAVLAMNARFMARLTSLLLRTFSARNDTKCLILNISSGGYVGLPFLSLYSATKAFNLFYSQSISREVSEDPTTAHVDCLAVIPGDVLSQGNDTNLQPGSPRWDAYGRMLVLTVDNAVAAGLRCFSPYWKHDIQVRLLGWVPDSLFTGEMLTLMGGKRRAYQEKHKAQ